MPEFNQSAPKKSGKPKKKMSQTTQMIIMAGVLVVCAVLITWTVMLLRERYAEQNMMNEQSSAFDIREQSMPMDEPETGTTVTEYHGFNDSDTTSTSSTTGDTTSATTAVQTKATAPPRVTAQSAIFSKIKTTSTVAISTGHAAHTTQHTNSNSKPSSTKHSSSKHTDTAATTTTTTTHTEPAETPLKGPEGAQIAYNELLALYLGANANGSAYFTDAHGNAPATVILHGDHAYYAVSEADHFSFNNKLGGTGDSSEHPWQTDSAFRIYQYDSTNRCIYYTSQGNEYQIIGYYDAATRENVWARLHYYQIGVAWQIEYHIMNGSQTEVLSGTCDAEDQYVIAPEFEQALDKELQNRNISAGSWSNYSEIKPNAQTDISALWNKAGEFNSGFTPQSGGVYGVVSAANGTALRASAGGNTIAELPAGTFVSIDSSALPLGNGTVEVQVLINGTWKTGVVDGSALLAWNG